MAGYKSFALYFKIIKKFRTLLVFETRSRRYLSQKLLPYRKMWKHIRYSEIFQPSSTLRENVETHQITTKHLS